MTEILVSLFSLLIIAIAAWTWLPSFVAFVALPVFEGTMHLLDWLDGKLVAAINALEAAAAKIEERAREDDL